MEESDWEDAFPEIAELTFTGNLSFYSWSLEKVMASKPRPFLQFWKKGEPYNPGTLKDDLLRLRKFYFDHGFLSTEASVAETHKDPQNNTVEIEIAIDEGLPTWVDDVDLQAQGEWPEAVGAKDKMLKNLPLKSGQRLNREMFDKSKAYLLRRMRDAGYARAEVIADTEIDEEDHEAFVTFNLYPGEIAKFGNISIKGQELIPERIIRRQIQIREGETYSPKILRDEQERIYDMGMFNTVTPRLVNIDDEKAPLDIKFDVSERKPHTGRLGVGASSIESMRYEVEWINRNLFGEAERLSVLARVSGIVQGLEAELHDPFFLTRDNSLTHKLYVLNKKRIDTDPFGVLDDLFNIVDPQPAYDLLTVGAESRLNHRFSRELTGALGLELSSNDFYNVDPVAVEEAGLEAVEDNILLIQFAGLEWNGRDDDLNPTKGEYITGQVEHSNTRLISDANFYKLTLEGRYYLPIGSKTVFATRLKLGGLQPYGDTEDVPSNVRYFAGGPGSVRGYALNRLGPLDSNGNPIGGNSLIEGSLELRFPLIGDFAGAVFVDFGNVFPPPFTYPLDELRYSAGPGIRYVTPIGPFRLDIGFPINRREGEDVNRIEFSIGQAF